MPPFLQDFDEGSSQSFVPDVKKNVRFALDDNEVFPVPHLDDLAEWEVQCMWLNRHDYDQIKMRIIPCVRRLMRGDKLDENVKETARGLEYRTKKGAQLRMANKLNAMHAVLDEQKRQWQSPCDENRIAFIYRRITAHCAVSAQDLGSQDEVEVRSFNDQPASVPFVERRNSLRQAPSTVSEAEPSLTERHFRGVARLLKQMRIRRTPLVDDDQSAPSAQCVAGLAA